VVALLAVACATAPRPGSPIAGPSTEGGSDGPVATLVAAGDIACPPWDEVTARRCQQEATATLVESLDPDTVLVLGDIAYDAATADELKGYDASWGRFLDRTRAVVGNHEYNSGTADAYWDYFGDRAGVRNEGWYSFDLGAWHVVVLNSECDEVGCDKDGPQGRWLAGDLAASSARCTLAAFHRPRFSSGDEHGDDESVGPFWEILQEAGADVVLTGHEHSYERFAPQRESGRPTADEGVAQFVVGTGGYGLRDFREPRPNSEVRWNGGFGVLAMTLRPDGYDWRFHATDGSDVDEGSAACRQ
jgi:acid phosphatase type 7